jgi:hypothetical protein
MVLVMVVSVGEYRELVVRRYYLSQPDAWWDGCVDEGELTIRYLHLG